MKIAGLDIGTTGCKLTVFDEKRYGTGQILPGFTRVCRAAGAHEMDISTMMESVYAVLGEMAAQYPDIAGIGVTSFGETFVMTNSAGEPLHNAMLSTDPRGAEECAALVDTLGAEHIAICHRSCPPRDVFHCQDDVDQKTSSGDLRGGQAHPPHRGFR